MPAMWWVVVGLVTVLIFVYVCLLGVVRWALAIMIGIAALISSLLFVNVLLSSGVVGELVFATAVGSLALFTTMQLLSPREPERSMRTTMRLIGIRSPSPSRALVLSAVIGLTLVFLIPLGLVKWGWL
jgi:hypothetical protein